MIEPHAQHTELSDEEALGGIIRIIRRICLLREEGNTREAREMERAVLAPALGELRAIDGTSVTDERIAELFDAEKRRVAEAVVLAELLIPQLTRGLQSVQPSSPAPAPAFLKPRPAQPAGASPAAIPDLLDGMLAGENASRRRRIAAAG